MNTANYWSEKISAAVAKVDGNSRHERMVAVRNMLRYLSRFSDHIVRGEWWYSFKDGSELQLHENGVLTTRSRV